jgi:hypothetical protein
MINAALQVAFNDLVAQFPANTFANTVAPFLDMDLDTFRFVLHAEQNFYRDNQGNPIRIYFNSRLYELFVGLRSIFIGNESDINYRLTVRDPRGTSLRSIKYGTTTFTFIQSHQEICSISLWNPVASIVFCSSLIPVVPTQTSKPNIFSNKTNNLTSGGDNSNITNILSDFEIAVDSTNQYRPFILYALGAEYRLIDLFSGNDLNRINIQVFWTDHFGNLNPLYVPAGCAAHLKLMFRRKDFSVSDV